MANQRRDLRILWSSNSPWSFSGYGAFSGQLVSRLHKDGWPIAVNCFYGLEGNPIEMDGIRYYPKMADPYGSDAIIAHGLHWKANVIITMQDVPTLIPEYLQKTKVWIPYMPVDKEPTPSPVLERIKFAYKIITFSKFGQETLQKSGYSSTMIHEGTDPDIFKPLDTQECRKELGLPADAFLFGMIAANKENPPRKGFQEAMEAFKMFLEKHPEAGILFHVQQPAPGGFPIKAFGEKLGILSRLYFMDDYKAIWHSPSTEINKEYNALDILLHPSKTEGFGLCIIEAQAAGIPVLIQGCQSQPELIIDGVTGETAKTLNTQFTNDLSFINNADPKSIYDCMEKLYRRLKSEPEKIAKKCRDHIINNFNINTQVKELWIPLLCDLQDELLPIQAEKK